MALGHRHISNPRFDDHLYVILPGIGGSVLTRGRGPAASIVWGGPKELAHRLLDPSGLEVGDDDGIRATAAISDWRILPGWSVIDGYAGLVDEVSRVTGLGVDWGDPDRPDDNAQIAVVPYDFRRGCADLAATLDDNISRRLRRFGDEYSWADRVVIIAHSMGGLVARHWAALDGRAERCKAIITLGTPHLGAPKLLDLVSRGLYFGGFSLANRTADVVRSWDATYDLLPSNRTISTEHGFVGQWEVDVERVDRGRAVTAHERHADLRQVWADMPPNARPTVVPVTGIARRTIEWSTLHGTQLRSHRVSACWDDLRGDGSVPRSSAVPDELNSPQGLASQRPVLSAKHNRLGGWDRLEAELRSIVLLRPSGTIHGRGARTIVTDIEDAWCSGAELALTVDLWEDGPAGASPSDPDVLVAVDLTVDGGPRQPLIRDADGGWSGTVQGLPAGDHTLIVRATTADGQDPPNVAETVRVVDDSALEALT